MSRSEMCEYVASWEEEDTLLSNYIKFFFSNKDALNILEAGCGQKWSLDLNSINYVLTGVDLDRECLLIRKKMKGDLDKTIWGDLKTIRLKESGYDIIYSSFVLEHIEGAEIVLDNFLKWLRSGGIIILRIPDRDSVYGFFARILPFWLHVRYKRYIEKVANAGEPGHGPFPTIYDKTISKKGIRDYCERHNLEIKLSLCSRHYLINFGKFSVFIKIFTKIIEMISLGKLDSRHNNLTFILGKH